MSEPQLSYPRLLEGLWDILNCTREGRERVLDRLSPAERAVLAQTNGWALKFEWARRRKTLSTTLLKTFPVTYFAFVATEGSEGVMRFCESVQARTRPPQPGSCFPPTASMSSAFAAYVASTQWATRQFAWVQEAAAFEATYLFGATTPPARHVEETEVALVDGAWVAEASFDVGLMAKLISEQGKFDPWDDVIALLKPKASPSAFISVPTAGQLRRMHLTGAGLAALRWLWDPSAEVPPGALDGAVLRRAVAAGAVRLERR